MTSIAVVVLDALRKDAFDDHFDWLPGIRYENAWSPSGWTVPVHGALFGGAYPSELGVYAKAESLTCDRPVLAEALSEAGYATRGFSANANISDAFQFTRGFDEFEHSWRGRRRDPDVVDWGEFVDATRGQGPGRFLRALYRCVASDADTLKSLRLGLRMKARDLGVERIAGADDGAARALDLVRETDFGTDEFLFANLMEAHGPYDPPEAYRTVEVDTNPGFQHTIFEGPDEDPGDIRQAYDDCVRYLSDVYEEIFAALVEDFEYVVTLADHGEMFGTDGLWEHNYGVYPQLTHVPLTVYRGREESATRTETVGLLDVHRTVLDLAGRGDVPSRGQHLLDDPDSREYLVERHGLRTARVRTLRNMDSAAELIRRYDSTLRGIVLPDGTYGWETDDGFRTRDGADPGAVGERMERSFERLDPAEVDPDAGADVPADVRDRLEELGYV